MRYSILKTLACVYLSTFVGMVSTPSAEAAAISATALDKPSVLLALQKLSHLTEITLEPSLTLELDSYFALPDSSGLLPLEIQKLFEKENIALWSGEVSDFRSLAAFVFEDLPDEEQAVARGDFDKSDAILHDYQNVINTYVRSIHPGYSPLNPGPLMKISSGLGVKIAVFDVFDPDYLKAQRKLYPRAKIQEPKVFGRPVELNHGNTVLAIILSLAPDAEILPVESDAKSYTEALEYVASDPAIDIINMSRAFAEGSDPQHLDPAFAKVLRDLVQSRILVKALGNTGSDLEGNLNSRRLTEGLGEVSSLAAYDTHLIQDLYAVDAKPDLLIFALNLNLFASDIALSATVPGKDSAVEDRTLGVPAEGIWSDASDTFESGSSFAAPQITALMALTLELQKKRSPLMSREEALRTTLKQMRESADRGDHTQGDWGLGMPRAERVSAAYSPSLR